jgi:hypothetical protein
MHFLFEMQHLFYHPLFLVSTDRIALLHLLSGIITNRYDSVDALVRTKLEEKKKLDVDWLERVQLWLPGSAAV